MSILVSVLVSMTKLRRIAADTKIIVATMYTCRSREWAWKACSLREIPSDYMLEYRAGRNPEGMYSNILNSIVTLYGSIRVSDIFPLSNLRIKIQRILLSLWQEKLDDSNPVLRKVLPYLRFLWSKMHVFFMGNLPVLWVCWTRYRVRLLGSSMASFPAVSFGQAFV